MNAFFSSSPIQLHKAVATIRMGVGLMLIYHGWEIFNPEVMKGYLGWEVFQFSAAAMLVYAGKSFELLAGVLLLLGLFTRLGALLTMGTFLYITFFVGQGRIWYEEQHPFLFALLGMMFFFTGPCAWSLDGVLFRKE